MPSKSVIVIGGGLAGLSSAVALAEAGLRVQLLEKRAYLGGRASSYLLPTGEHVDNCQHVTLGCCTNLDDFYRRMGATHKIRRYSRLYFADPAGRRGTVEASPLPPPFHLAPSFALFPSLTWADKRAIIRAMLTIVRSGGRPADADGTTMLEWLRRHRQTESSIQRFWRVVLVSALNEELGRTDARYGVDVFWKAFLANRAGYELGIPAVPLGELYDGCRAAVERRGGEVRTRCGAREIRVAGGRVAGVALENSDELAADFYLAAVPHDLLLNLLPPAVVEREPALANLRHLRSVPITGVHLWFDRTVMAEPFLTVLDRTTQWIFNKSRLYGPRAATGRHDIADGEDASWRPSWDTDSAQYLQLVISASYDLVPRSRQEIIELCLRELLEIFPSAREAQLLKATVVKEIAATFSPEPGCDRWRPAQASPVKNLFLAGDWTATGWPATMEGAVRSGYLAAEAILAAAGEPRNLVQADLPAEGLAAAWAPQIGPSMMF